MHNSRRKSLSPHVTFFYTLFVILFGLSLAGCGTPNMGDPSSGRSSQLRTAFDDTPQRQRARTRLELAAAYFENNQALVALDEVKRALAVDDAYPDAHNLMGLVLTSLNEPALARESYQRAVSLQPDHGDALHNWARLQCQVGQYDSAMALFARALAVPNYKNAGKTWLAQGVCQLAAGRTAAAQQSLLRAYEIDPTNPIAGYNLSRLYYQQNNMERAQFYLKRLHQAGLGNSETAWLAAKVERKLGNQALAGDWVRTLQKDFPTSKEMDLLRKGAWDD